MSCILSIHNHKFGAQTPWQVAQVPAAVGTPRVTAFQVKKPRKLTKMEDVLGTHEDCYTSKHREYMKVTKRHGDFK